MLDPETIPTVQGFAFGIAQGLITSVIVEGKKLKDEKNVHEKAKLLENHEHSKPLEDRIGQRVCAALQQLNLSREELGLILPLASDEIFRAELARQILEETYSPEEVTAKILQCSPSSESLGVRVKRIATLLVDAIHSAIADDPQLYRAKSLRFQSQITERVVEVKAEVLTIKADIPQFVTKAVMQAFREKSNAFSDNFGMAEIREKIFHAKIDEARKLLNSGKPKTARGILEELRQETIKQDVSKSLLVRIATNLGCCAIQLNDEQNAIREIDLAYQLDPENPKSVANASASNLLKGNPQKALDLAERARELAPKDSAGTANYINALFALGRDAEVSPLIEKEGWISTDANCCYAIGLLFFNRDRFADAEKFSRLGLVHNGSDPRLLTLLAHAIIRPIQNPLLGQPILDWRFPAEAVPKLRDAETMLTQAITAQGYFEDRRGVVFAHVLRADVRRMLKDTSGAISDCEIALHHNPSDDSALSIKALAHFNLEQFDESIAAFNKIMTPNAKQLILLPLAAAYNANEDYGKAIALLGAAWDAVPNNPDQIKIAHLLLWAHGQLKDAKAADLVIEKLQTTWPKHPDALSTIARYRVQQGKTDEAIGLFKESLAYASGPAKDFVALDLADILYAQKEYSKAAELYESVADLVTNNDVSRRYLMCLYYTGLHKEALSLARSLRGSGEPVPVISQIEANILSEIGDMTTARETMKRLSDLHPKIPEYRISAAQFAIRCGDNAAARTLVDGIPFEDIEGNPSTLLLVAKFRAALGMEQVLRYLYQARRSGYSSAEIHVAYAALFLNREQVDHVDLVKDTVDGDCGVLVKVGNDVRGYTVLSEEKLHPEQGEISREQAQEMLIMGRKKGDKVVIGKHPFGQEVEGLILDVQSKYVRAFQETLKQFPLLFPTDKTLQGIAGSYEELRDGMLHQLDVQQIELRKVIDFYDAKKIPFESLAGLIHRSPVELWGMLAGGRYCAFANFSGSADDAQTESETVSQSDALLVDLTAILTFAQLGLLEKLEKRYKLVTVQPVLDALTESHASAATSKPSLTIGKDGDAYVRQEITSDDLVARKAFFDGIIIFLKQHVTIRPVPSLLEQDLISKDLRKFLGPITTAVCFAARDEKLILYSDDEVLRVLARNEWKIRGVSVQFVLHELAAKGILSKDELLSAIAKLIFLNFRVVLINLENVLWLVDKGRSRVTPELQKMLSVLHGPKYAFEPAADMLADATKQVWLDNPLYHRKVELLETFLDALGTNRPTNQVGEYFSRAIRIRFFLAPHVSDTIAEHVRQWKERKLGREGIIVPPRYLSKSG